jgi:hypothetical protein
MIPKKIVLPVLANAGMEITWRLAWANFLTLSIVQRPFPLPVALIAFISAAFFTRLAKRRNWRRIQAALIQVSGFILTAIVMAYGLFFRETSFLTVSWLIDLGRQLMAPQHWLILIPVFGCLLLFWLGGRTFEKNSRDYLPVCLQFDKGLGAFFLLLLIKFLAQLKGGLVLEDPAIGFLVVAFFLFSLLTISLTRGRDDMKKAYLAGYRGLGIILGFATTVVLSGAALILLTFPYLTQMADFTQRIIKETTAPLGPIIVRILRFIFRRTKFGIETGSRGTTGSGGDIFLPTPTGSWEDTLLEAISWGLMSIIGLMAIGVCAYLITFVVRWLLRRSSPVEFYPPLSTPFLKWASNLKMIFQTVWDRVPLLFGRADSAASVYAGICRWGRRSGQALIPSETPTEYGNRLSSCFPAFKADIDVIIAAFNREIYGESPTERVALRRILSALGRMQRIRHWPRRLRAWVVPKPHNEE